MFWPHNGWIEMCLRSELDSTNICLLVLCYIRSSRRAYLLINTILPFLYPVSTHPQTDDLFSLSLLFCKLTQKHTLASFFVLSFPIYISLPLSNIISFYFSPLSIDLFIIFVFFLFIPFFLSPSLTSFTFF